MASVALNGPIAGKDCGNRLEKNHAVFPEASGLDVFSVQLDLLLKRDIAASGDLPCTGDAGGDVEAFALR